MTNYDDPHGHEANSCKNMEIGGVFFPENPEEVRLCGSWGHIIFFNKSERTALSGPRFVLMVSAIPAGYKAATKGAQGNPESH